MKSITIYKIKFHDGYESTFKGIDDLRDFAVDRLYCGWETNTTEEDLNDDDRVIDFIRNDYGEELEIIATINENDLK